MKLYESVGVERESTSQNKVLSLVFFFVFHLNQTNASGILYILLLKDEN